jgi:hypothetical protein
MQEEKPQSLVRGDRLSIVQAVSIGRVQRALKEQNFAYKRNYMRNKGKLRL